MQQSAVWKEMRPGKELMGSSLINKSSFLSTSKVLKNHSFPENLQQNHLLVSPALVTSRQRKVRMKKVVKSPAAATGEDLIKTNRVIDFEKPDKYKVTAFVTVGNKNKEDCMETILKQLDGITDMIGKNVVLELISTEVDPKTKAPKRSNEAVLKDWLKNSNVKAERFHHTAEFTVDSNFGLPGAITVINKHHREFFLESITIQGFACGPVHFPCNSWVQSRKDHPGKRIFFSNKPYLPSETPAGLRALREEELKNLRGDGKGVRKLSDRIYDFDIYNDLGKPDKGFELARPKFGGAKIPYPRRCRTGRVPCDNDMEAESRVEKPLPIYVPRDEQFEKPKLNTFKFGRLKGVLHNVIPLLKTKLSPDNNDFNSFADIDVLFREGLLLKAKLHDDTLKKLPKIVSKIQECGEAFIRYNTPDIISKDKFAWLRDDEFARQALSGVNPVTIERLKVFPPKSNLDPEIYGPLESAFKEDHLMPHLNGMSVQQALEENKLYIIDYHDTYLPFLERINALDGIQAHATRTIFFLTPLGTLKPIAIELSLPPTMSNSKSKQVVMAPVDATANWIWQLAKAHVWCNDCGAHQLVKHWLRTHACMEPFIIAAHRQLSAMHPIYKLLDPHMRYTLEINALARQNLISADGVIENCFSPGRYAIDISAAAYKSWRFDQEGLPADLITRGIAVPDPTKPHGLKLLIEDYPYAQDGLLIWSAIEKWIRTYVDHYYPDSSLVCNDTELQAWYTESVKVGHADVSEAGWWPKLENSDDLTSILTTLIWLVSAQHAALNFGQYPYGGYVPNRPTLTRRLLPEENDPDYENFLADPQKYFLSALPSLLQSTKIMAVIANLSTHSPDEEYLGERQQPSSWTSDAEMVEAFDGFSAEMKRIEEEIDRRNKDPGLRNRCGAGVLPYELLIPSSGPGVTGRGVPNSVSI